MTLFPFADEITHQHAQVHVHESLLMMSVITIAGILEGFSTLHLDYGVGL